MSDARGPQTIADIRRRFTFRLELLDFLEPTDRAFGLAEVPTGIAHGSFFVLVAAGVSLPTHKVNDSNGFDWQSNVHVTVAYKLDPHSSLEDHDKALAWAHRIVNHLVRQSADWPIDIRVRGDGVSVAVDPDLSGQFLLIRVGLFARHNLSIVEAP
jgi:hypothetical protein